MGHNTSDRKLRELQAQAALESRVGWRQVGKGGRWEAVRTPVGLQARRAQLVGRCASADCSRRIRFDPRWWIDRGQGATELAVLERAYECARVPCGLRWTPEYYPRGVPLMAYVDEPGAHVAVGCRACKATRSYPLPWFVDQVVRVGRSADLSRPAWSLTGMVRGPCRMCGAPGLAVLLIVPGKRIEPPPGVGA